MNDWNGNGKYDAADSYMDYKLSGAKNHTSHKSGNNRETSCGVLIYMFFMIIMLAALPGVGLIMLGALIWFWMCGGL